MQNRGEEKHDSVGTHHSKREVLIAEAAGRYGTGKGSGVIGHGQQQRCGRDEALRLRHELLLHRVTTRASSKNRRIEETVVVLRHLKRLRRRTTLDPRDNYLCFLYFHWQFRGTLVNEPAN